MPWLEVDAGFRAEHPTFAEQSTPKPPCFFGRKRLCRAKAGLGVYLTVAVRHEVVCNPFAVTLNFHGVNRGICCGGHGINPNNTTIGTISYDFANTTLATGVSSHSTPPLLPSLSFFLSAPLCSLCLLDSYRKFLPKLTFLMAR
jgi:hypothetical protein